MVSRRQLLAAMLVGALLTVGAHAAVGMLFATQSSDSYRASSGVRFNATDGPLIIFNEDIQVQSGNPFDSPNGLTINNVSFNSSGKTRATLGDLSASRAELYAIQTNGNDLTVDLPEANRVDIDGNPSVLRLKDVSTDPSDDGVADYYLDTDNAPTNMTIHGLSPGNYIRVYDTASDQLLADGTTTDAGTVSLSFPPGTYGVDLQREPKTLYIREESNPSQLVNTTTVNLEFYVPNSDQVYQRSTSTGEIDISFLPQNQRIVVNAKASGYQDRQVYLEDIARQQSIYLLNETSTTTVPITFVVDDKSGSYPADSTTIEIQQVINDTTAGGIAKWQTVAGGSLSASSDFGPVELRKGVRHRIIVSNVNGDRRVLGEYTPTQQETKTLVIRDIQWESPDQGGVYTDASLNTTQGTEVKALYNDTEGKTEQLDITVFNDSQGPNNPIYTVTEYGVASHSETFTIPKKYGADLYVRFVADRGNTTLNRTIPLGQVQEQSINIDQGWLRLFAQIALVGIIGLVAGSMHVAGGIIVVSIGFALTWLGVWTIHPAALGIAGAVAVLGALYSPGGAV